MLIQIEILFEAVICEFTVLVESNMMLVYVFQCNLDCDEDSTSVSYMTVASTSNENSRPGSSAGGSGANCRKQLLVSDKSSTCSDQDQIKPPRNSRARKNRVIMSDSSEISGVARNNDADAERETSADSRLNTSMENR